MLDRISLRIEAGESIVVYGHNGSGKSSLLLLLADLIAPTEGTRRSGLRNPPSILFADPERSLLSGVVSTEIAFALESHNAAQFVMEAKIRAHAKQFGIESLLERQTETLSGGEMQLTAAAAATIVPSSVLLLDEPELFLDAHAADRFEAAIDAFVHATNSSLVRATTRLAIAKAARRLIVLAQGRVVFDGLGSAFEDQQAVSIPARADHTQSACQSIDRLRLSEISFSYTAELPLLRSVSLEIRSGQIAGLCGANGSGKTTLAKVASGLLIPHTGGVEFRSSAHWREITKPAPSLVSYVMQRPERQFCMPTVREELLLAPTYLHVDLSAGSFSHLCAQLGIGSDLLSRDPVTLSTGEQRRVAIASMLTARPRFLWLDEPSAGLDPLGKRQLAELLFAMADSGTGSIIISHDAEWLCEVCDRTVLLQDGVLEQSA